MPDIKTLDQTPRLALYKSASSHPVVVLTPAEILGVTDAASDTARPARDAILEQLYATRHELLERERLGHASTRDLDLLRDVNADIDRWELEEQDRAQGDVWERLESLAAFVLGRDAK